MFAERRRRLEIERWRKQRLLFRYWDGQEVRAIDPFRVYREIKNDKTIDLDTVGPMADRLEEPATTQLVELACRIFDIKRYDGKTDDGLTDAEILNLFGDLNEYLDAIKKKCSPGPTLQPSTA
jgi:hypothetical protein